VLEDTIVRGEINGSGAVILTRQRRDRKDTSKVGWLNGFGSHFRLYSIAVAIIADVLSATDVVSILRGFSPGKDGEALKSRELTLALLAWSPDPFSRRIYTPGHITCTGVVLSPKRKRVLLVHHGRLERWLLPGGHCEPGDPDISSVARREVIEETGSVLMEQPAVLVGIDVHPIPCNGKEPLHLHHDLIFGFQAKSSTTECSAESREVAWCELDEFDRYDLPSPIRKATLRAIRDMR
jgi:8-oxo-dGTP pyrophosphatase MutT (NUDIX family)